MKLKAAGTILLIVGTALLGACRDAKPPAASERSPTSVLGNAGPSPSQADGIAQPPGVPAGTQAKIARTGADTALAAWVQDGRVVAASYAKATGWTAAQPLEEIYGEDSDPQLASDSQGTAMAIWRHTVGSIESLRYSRFDSSGWSVPDVMPGALPQPRTAKNAAPRLQMDAQGQAVAEWTSGFDASRTQSTRYVPGQGWTHASSSALASAAPASPSPR
ncbi:hypothetical protein LZ009_12675 [Ramlibacter sp. XY19]|uniref:hypothetical protein n=1 Tax=Ramlibacter paludis TaxID=2908000 RepID=UPI0023DBFD44|nr:hypothetical protein [Ramlibacter paludis]MCG2593633.1 hypothetical protein [Ramlibacter paludis]